MRKSSEWTSFREGFSKNSITLLFLKIFPWNFFHLKALKVLYLTSIGFIWIRASVQSGKNSQKPVKIPKDERPIRRSCDLLGIKSWTVMQQLSSYRMNERGHRISLKKIVEHFVYFNSATRVMATQRKANHDNISHNLQKKKTIQ